LARVCLYMRVWRELDGDWLTSHSGHTRPNYQQKIWLYNLIETLNLMFWNTNQLLSKIPLRLTTTLERWRSKSLQLCPYYVFIIILLFSVYCCVIRLQNCFEHLRSYRRFGYYYLICCLMSQFVVVQLITSLVVIWGLRPGSDHRIFIVGHFFGFWLWV